MTNAANDTFTNRQLDETVSSIWGNDDEDVIKDFEGDRSMGQSRLIPRYYIYLDPAHLVTKDSDS